MRKTVPWSLILAACVSGCDVAAVIGAPPAERVTASGLKGKAQKVQKLQPRDEQPEQGASNEKQQASNGDAAPPPATGDAPASEASGSTATLAPSAERTTLKLVEPPPVAIGVIPVLADDGGVSSLIFQGDRSTLTWKVDATRGPQALTVSKIKLTLTPLSWYPIPEDPFASQETAASDAVASDAAASEAGEASAETPPKVVELAPGDLAWPTTVAAGASQTLSYELDNATLRSFLEDYYGVSSFSLSITLLDGSGDPLTDAEDTPFKLHHAIQVL